ncbi:hypothetical protein QBC39DRAFT_334579 [Podospora conica]|nr:hypothetical protein QBC39DRAFT_334579 [Schizothecium conicum]
MELRKYNKYDPLNGTYPLNCKVLKRRRSAPAPPPLTTSSTTPGSKKKTPATSRANLERYVSFRVILFPDRENDKDSEEEVVVVPGATVVYVISITVIFILSGKVTYGYLTVIGRTAYVRYFTGTKAYSVALTRRAAAEEEEEEEPEESEEEEDNK